MSWSQEDVKRILSKEKLTLDDIPKPEKEPAKTARGIPIGSGTEVDTILFISSFYKEQLRRKLSTETEPGTVCPLCEWNEDAHYGFFALNSRIFPRMEILPPTCHSESDRLDQVGHILVDISLTTISYYTDSLYSTRFFYSSTRFIGPSLHVLASDPFIDAVRTRLHMSYHSRFTVGPRAHYQFVQVFTSTRDPKVKAEVPPGIDIEHIMYLVSDPDALDPNKGGYMNPILRTMNHGFFDIMFAWPAGDFPDDFMDALRFIYAALGHCNGPRYAIGIPVGHPGQPGSSALLGHIVYISGAQVRTMKKGNIRGQRVVNEHLEKYLKDNIPDYDPLLPRPSDAEKRDSYIKDNKNTLFTSIASMEKDSTTSNRKRIGVDHCRCLYLE